MLHTFYEEKVIAIEVSSQDVLLASHRLESYIVDFMLFLLLFLSVIFC